MRHIAATVVLILSFVTGASGHQILQHTYDALGRLARLQRPLAGYPGYVHAEHFYYDGARRIQEVLSSLAAPSGGDEQSSQGETQTPTIATWAEREYIHTAGPGSYVDEYICEVAGLNSGQIPLFHLQDANYTVVGLVNAAGAVVRQHTFDAYGQLLYAEDLQAAPTSRIGHQGLFFDRLDAPQGSRDLTPRHTPTATPGVYTLAQIDGHYQNRNRTYSPGLQRFVQRDPNGTALQAAAGAGTAGLAPMIALSDADASSMFVDGVNLHAYALSSPVAEYDPSGLFTLGGVMNSTAMRNGMQAYGTADRARGLLDMVKSLATGASLESALVGLAFDLVLDKVGGKALDGLMDRARTLRQSIASGKGPRPPPRSLDRPGDRPDTFVYALLSDSAHMQYFGITNDPKRRESEHQRGKFSGMRMLVLTPMPLSRLQARALETALIMRARTSGDPNSNQRRSLTESFPEFDDAMDWAGSMMRALGL